jgi:hypothetical protein
MKAANEIKFWWAAVPALVLLAFGCASANVNPRTARANTGYVDLFTATNSGLAWEVQRLDAATESYKRIFSQLDPVPGGILRLAFPPGEQKLRVTFLNHVIVEPVVVEVPVLDGKVTPVEIALIEAGDVSVQTRVQTFGGTARGFVGRRYKYGTDDTPTYNLTATVQTPQPYAPKPATANDH